MLPELPLVVQYNIHVSHQIAVCIQHFSFFDTLSEAAEKLDVIQSPTDCVKELPEDWWQATQEFLDWPY